MAVIISDFEFLDHNECIVTLTEVSDIDKIKYVRIRWRKQKNKNNGEKIQFARDRNQPKFCPVLAAARIVLQALRLGIPQDQPLAVFRNNKNDTRFITAKLVSNLLRDAASDVLQIPCNVDSIKLWSCHSLRVTAANVLHRDRMSDLFIQNRLRWKSKSFLMYLHNTFYSASQHNASLKVSDSNLPPITERTYHKAEPHEQIMAPAA